jgi:MFS family permease
MGPIATASELNDVEPRKALPSHRGVVIGSITVFISVLGAAVTFPFLQAQRDRFECDALCYGSMQSLRSGLTLAGNMIVGRLSDRMGRKFALWLGVAANLSTCVLNYQTETIDQMRIAMIPSSLLNQNYTVLKALFADYNSEMKGSEADKASAMGKLGMSVGISFMVGPALGAMMLSSYKEACIVAGSLTLVSAIVLAFLPNPALKRIDSEANLPDLATSGGSFKGLFKFLYLPAVQSSGAKLLIALRLLMGLAFNVFMTIWTVSLKKRFDFGPKEHAFFMGWIGLCYALSQGVIAQHVIKRAGRNPTGLLCACAVSLSAGRILAMLTTNIVGVYIIMAAVIIALGILNTAMTSAVTKLADADQVGGLIGVIEAIENSAGLVGPALGGVLFKIGEWVPLGAVVLFYGAVFVLLWLFYEAHIVNGRTRFPTKYKDE